MSLTFDAGFQVLAEIMPLQLELIIVRKGAEILLGKRWSTYKGYILWGKSLGARLVMAESWETYNLIGHQDKTKKIHKAIERGMKISLTDCFPGLKYDLKCFSHVVTLNTHPKFWDGCYVLHFTGEEIGGQRHYVTIHLVRGRIWIQVFSLNPKYLLFT